MDLQEVDLAPHPVVRLVLKVGDTEQFLIVRWLLTPCQPLTVISS